MKDNETVWDERLHIKTDGRDDINSDEYRFPYEPTPYAVLQCLAESELILKGDTVLDYGCGKGRVGFYLSHTTKANCIGIEYDERIYRSAISNQMTASALHAIGEVGGPRCCKRDSYLSIIKAVEFTKQRLGVEMELSKIKCVHFHQNNQCMKERCPFW